MEVIAGRYRLVERLGAGGMSVVWRAFDEVLGRQVAIKVLAANLAGDPDFARRIRLEARAAARLAHPNIGVVYDFGECTDADGQRIPFIVMELIDGPSLAEIVAPDGMPWRQAVAICGQVAAGLAAAHARGLVHSDVKPANVMLPAAGVKVVDFGISAVVGDQADSAPDGTLLGTPAYISPERLIGAPVRPAADVYGLGVLLHMTLTGHLPWQVEGARLLRAHLELPPDTLNVDGMPGEVAELYEGCLAKDPADRPSAQWVATRLAAAAGLSLPPASAARAGDGWVGADLGRPTAFLPLTVGNTRASAATTASALTTGSGTATPTGPAGLRRWLTRVGSHPRRTGSIVLTLLAALATVTTVAANSRGAASTGTLTMAAAHACRVTYQIRDDTAGQFRGSLTVGNIGPGKLTDWTVSFKMPGDQHLDPGHPPVWSQTGQAVTLRPGEAMAVPNHQEATFAFSGTYHASNPLPVAFTLNNAPCDVQLLGPSGVATPPAGGQAGTASAGPTPGAPKPGAPAPSPTPSPSKGKGKDKGNGGGDGNRNG